MSLPHLRLPATLKTAILAIIIIIVVIVVNMKGKYHPSLTVALFG